MIFGKSVELRFLPAISCHSVSSFTFLANVKLTSFSALKLGLGLEEDGAEGK